jgi:hypothetical protein
MTDYRMTDYRMKLWSTYSLTPPYRGFAAAFAKAANRFRAAGVADQIRASAAAVIAAAFDRGLSCLARHLGPGPRM